MKYRIKIVKYKSGLIEYYPQYKQGLFKWNNFTEIKCLPINSLNVKDTYRVETDVYRLTLDKAKEFLNNLYPKISYDYNWNKR